MTYTQDIILLMLQDLQRTYFGSAMIDIKADYAVITATVVSRGTKDEFVFHPDDKEEDKKLNFVRYRNLLKTLKN